MATYITGIRRATANIDVRVEPEPIEKVDAWGSARCPPSHTAAIVRNK